MNNCCYTLVIKQLVCQNNVSKRIDNACFNMALQSEIPVSFGYVITYISGSPSAATITLSNPIFIPNITFNIPANSFKVFDLPCQCGTYRLYIGAIPTPCNTCCCAN